MLCKKENVHFIFQAPSTVSEVGEPNPVTAKLNIMFLRSAETGNLYKKELDFWRSLNVKNTQLTQKG